MKVDYFYCPSCGLEDYDVFVDYSRKTAIGDWWFCPSCGEESSHVEVGVD